MSKRIAAWLMPEQIPMIQRIAAAVEVTVTSAGSPMRGQSAAVANAFDAVAVDDLRSMLVSADVDLILLASAGTFGIGSRGDDAEAVQAANVRGVEVATFEPVPPTALELASGGWMQARGGGLPVEMLRFVPLMRLSRPFREATEVLESFGECRLLSLESWCRPHESSLGALLYSAMDLILSLMGEPETADATYVWPAQASGMHMLPGESLAELRGALSANLRFGDGRAASLVVSDQGGRWNRYATLLGPRGRLRVFDDGFEWLSMTGEKIDQSRATTGVRGGPPADHVVTAAADALSRLLDPASPDPGPTNHAAVLGMAQAALLSARTGQSESPATIRRMASVR